MVLGHSRDSFVGLVGSMDLVTFWACHRAAFAHFGGVPRELLYDRTKKVIRSHVGRERRVDERLYHPEALASAQHYGFRLRLRRARRAKTKGKVESNVPYVRERLFRGQRFRDYEEANRRWEGWNGDVAGRRLYGTTARSSPCTPSATAPRSGRCRPSPTWWSSAPSAAPRPRGSDRLSRLATGQARRNRPQPGRRGSVGGPTAVAARAADRRTEPLHDAYLQRAPPDSAEEADPHSSMTIHRHSSITLGNRGDVYQLVAAGLRGGKTVPESVCDHPMVFVTLTAPSFGPVHSRRMAGDEAQRCRPRRRAEVCRHGVRLSCGDPRRGRPAAGRASVRGVI